MKSGGFTLIEILAAMTIASLVFVLIGQTQRLGLRSVHQQLLLVHESHDLRTVDQTLREALRQIDPGTRARPLTPIGTQNRLVLQTRCSDGETSKAELMVDAAGHLVLYCDTETILARDVARLDLHYQRAGTPGVWLATWTGPGNPQLIRADLAWTDPHHPPWPALIVAPLHLRPRD